jgi:hypothetical protein
MCCCHLLADIAAAASSAEPSIFIAGPNAQRGQDGTTFVRAERYLLPKVDKKSQTV